MFAWVNCKLSWLAPCWAIQNTQRVWSDLWGPELCWNKPSLPFLPVLRTSSPFGEQTPRGIVDSEDLLSADKESVPNSARRGGIICSDCSSVGRSHREKGSVFWYWKGKQAAFGVSPVANELLFCRSDVSLRWQSGASEGIKGEGLLAQPRAESCMAVVVPHPPHWPCFLH